MKEIVNVNTYYNLFRKIYNNNPYDYQLKAIDLVLNNQTTVHAWSRRIGKTLTFSTLAILQLLVPNSDVLLLAPFLNLTDIAFKYVYKGLNILGLKPTKANFKDHVIELENNSTILCVSLKNISQVLGRSYDLVLLDEFAVWDKCNEIVLDSPKSIQDVIFAGEELLHQDLYPTILERKGRLVIFSTFRKKKNLFYKLWKKYPSTLVTIYEQNHISRAEIEVLKEQYKKSNQYYIFEQEFLCKPTDEVTHGRVYEFDLKYCKQHNNSFLISTNMKQIPYKHFDFFIGADPGYVHPFGLTLVGFALPYRTGDLTYEGEPAIVVVDCFKKSKPHLSEIAEVIHKWEEQYPILEYYCDYANKNVMDELAVSHDISFKNAVKDVETGIGFVNSIQDFLYINKSSDNVNLFVDEFNNYKIKNGKIVKIDDDIMDSFRYAVYSAYVDFYPDFFLDSDKGENDIGTDKDN